jgi:hypothetical protein
LQDWVRWTTTRARSRIFDQRPDRSLDVAATPPGGDDSGEFDPMAITAPLSRRMPSHFDQISRQTDDLNYEMSSLKRPYLSSTPIGASRRKRNVFQDDSTG